jgi:hypothetical protein
MNLPFLGLLALTAYAKGDLLSGGLNPEQSLFNTNLWNNDRFFSCYDGIIKVCVGNDLKTCTVKKGDDEDLAIYKQIILQRKKITTLKTTRKRNSNVGKTATECSVAAEDI